MTWPPLIHNQTELQALHIHMDVARVGVGFGSEKDKQRRPEVQVQNSGKPGLRNSDYFEVRPTPWSISS
jgi:hypothetical protein